MKLKFFYVIVGFALASCATPNVKQDMNAPTRNIQKRAAFMCNARPWDMGTELREAAECVTLQGPFRDLEERDNCRYQLRWIEQQMSTYSRCYGDALDLKANEIYSDALMASGEKPVEIAVPELADIKSSYRKTLAEKKLEQAKEAEKKSEEFIVAPIPESYELPLPKRPDCVNKARGKMSNPCRQQMATYRTRLDRWVEESVTTVIKDIERFALLSRTCLKARTARKPKSLDQCSLEAPPNRMPN